jgi:uncharacterized protein (TIGR04222 family)
VTNPLYWTGPPFLCAYAALGLIVIGLVIVVRRVTEGGTPPVMAMNDAAWMACLRDGPAEAVRITVASLVDRGLVRTDDLGRFYADEDRQGFARRPLEQAVCDAVSQPATISTILADPGVQAAAAAYERQLRSLGLLADDSVWRQRRVLRWLALSVLLGVAAAKLVVALTTGHSNVAFLIGLAGLFGGYLAMSGRAIRTLRGETLLVDVRTLFSALRHRAAMLQRGGATSDLALLAAVYGLGAVPERVLPARIHVDPRLQPATTLAGVGYGIWSNFRNSEGIGSGSSCGGGSSCSGGGCGGGCGGCGG